MRFGVEMLSVISTRYVYSVVAISRCKHGDAAKLLRLYSVRFLLVVRSFEEKKMLVMMIMMMIAGRVITAVS